MTTHQAALEALAGAMTDAAIKYANGHVVDFNDEAKEALAALQPAQQAQAVPADVLEQNSYYAPEIAKSPLPKFMRADLASPPQAQPGFVAMPTSADEAAGMVLVGTAWLQEHAPERMKQPEQQANITERWNIERAGADLLVCFNNHEKEEPCQYVRYSPASEQPATTAEAYKQGEWYMAKDVDDMQRFFRSRLPAIREAAREHGYAIGVHGSERRDFDLIATPWCDGASDPETLAHAVAQAACGIDRSGAYNWTQKPAGRVAVTLPICWVDDDRPSAGCIDLSVMQQPAAAVPAYAPLTRDEVCALSAMQAGAPWDEPILTALAECIAIAEQLRAEGKRPVDPADMTEAESAAHWAASPSAQEPN